MGTPPPAPPGELGGKADGIDRLSIRSERERERQRERGEGFGGGRGRELRVEDEGRR